MVDFISTETYENRYDLDEIDVFLEGDSSNPMFFSINGLPNQLSYGKHYFNLSILNLNKHQYSLRDNSRILFEFKSKNNVIIKSDVVDLNQRNGVAVCYVEVLKDPLYTYEEIEDGEGTFIVASSLVENSKSAPRIPKKFKHAINYRCVFPIEIRKNLLNSDSPKLTNPEHKIQTSDGQFTFVKAPLSPLKTTGLGLTYNKVTGRPNVSYSTGRGGRGSGKS